MKVKSKFLWPVLGVILGLGVLYTFGAQIISLVLTYVSPGSLAVVEARQRTAVDLGIEFVTREGRPVNVAQQQGKVILLSFWHPK